MPRPGLGRGARRMQVHAEIAVLVGLDLNRVPAEPGGDAGPRHRPPGDAAAQIAPLRPQGVRILPRGPGDWRNTRPIRKIASREP